MRYRVEFFQPKEFICPCCGRGNIAASLAYFLDMTRRAWDSPILVNSGHRCQKHNAEVGGSPTSRHMIGCAADIRPKDNALIEPFKYLIQHLTARLEGWEIRYYPRFIHIAVPREEEPYKWSGGLLNVSIKAVSHVSPELKQ